jgi:uncharacterized protein with PIN domain
VVVELLWYGFVAAYALGAALYFGLGFRTPRCRDCRTPALMLSRHVPGTFPPVFEVVYRCPTCGETLWKHFVSTVND